MPKKRGPGKSYRRGMSLIEAVKQFSDEAEVERMFIKIRWPGGVACPNCGSKKVREISTRKPAPFKCYDCKKCFSVKTGTVMHSSNLPLSKWALASYLMMTNLKGVSSMKLHRDLGITQKSAWHLAHRIREAWNHSGNLFGGPVEADEVFIGGKESNKHANKKMRAGRGPVGKAVVAGAKDRETNQISAAHVRGTDRATLHGFITDRTKPDALVFTDEAPSYRGLPRQHQVIQHRTGEYVKGMAHTNGIESFWAMLRRGYYGTYHKMSPKHLERYVNEFAGRHNSRSLDTRDQIALLVKQMDGKQLRYSDLIGPVETRYKDGI